MQYLVFATEADARAIERTIFSRGAILAQSVGYELDASGAIVGERDGVPDPTGVTTVWDNPKQRADGAWVILHPLHHPAASTAGWLSFVMHGIDAPAETEPDGGAWWPLPEVLEG